MNPIMIDIRTQLTTVVYHTRFPGHSLVATLACIVALAYQISRPIRYFRNRAWRRATGFCRRERAQRRPCILIRLS